MKYELNQHEINLLLSCLGDARRESNKLINDSLPQDNNPILKDLEIIKNLENKFNPNIRYDIELLRDIGTHKKGERIRGECINTNDFSRFKRWWLETNDLNNIYMADIYTTETSDRGAVARLMKETFKTVTIIKSEAFSV